MQNFAGNRLKSCIVLILRTFTVINYPSKGFLPAIFVKLPITYKSQKSNFKISKSVLNKKVAPEYV